MRAEEDVMMCDCIAGHGNRCQSIASYIAVLRLGDTTEARKTGRKVMRAACGTHAKLDAIVHINDYQSTLAVVLDRFPDPRELT